MSFVNNIQFLLIKLKNYYMYTYINFPKVYIMWLSSVKIEHYYAWAKNELIALIKALGLPLHCVQV